MKLASLRTAGRDGRLVVVSRDLARAMAGPVAYPTLQSALDNWSDAQPQLQRIYEAVQSPDATGAFPFDPQRVAPPLPRAYQWCDGSAFMSHGKRMQKAFALPPIADEDAIPMMYQGASDDFTSAYDDIRLPSVAHGIDFEGEFGIIVDDAPMGCNAEAAADHIKLIVMLNDISLRHLQPREMKTGFGLLQAKPTTSFAPVAVTPDELGAEWRDGRVHVDLCAYRNGALVGNPNGGEMTFSFFRLLEHVALTRRLGAGTIIGSGTVSNADPNRGMACISERRAIEMMTLGEAVTPYLGYGERIRLEAFDAQGGLIFGAIDQRITESEK